MSNDETNTSSTKPSTSEARKLWADALRSGEYKQGDGLLRYESNGQACYCCLGVACDLYQKHVAPLDVEVRDNGITLYGGHTAACPKPVAKWLNINNLGDLVTRLGKHRCLAAMNDSGETFADIADVIDSGNLKPFTSSEYDDEHDDE